MDPTAQDDLANGLLTLFGCILLEGALLFAGWLGYKAKELLWPHPKARAMAGPAWSLLLVGFQCMIGGLILSAVPELMGYGVIGRPGGIDWNGWGVIGVQIGLVSICAAGSWMGMLSFLYPRETSPSDGIRLIRRKDVVGVSMLIGLTVGGVTALLILLWTKDSVIGFGTWAGVALVTYPIAFLVLNRVFRQRRQAS